MSLKEQIEKHLETLITTNQEKHFVAARYALLNGGKRVRPLIAIIVSDMLGVSVEKSINAACALELIHTYSLIHDDLPSMDNDDLRRGKPSLHKAFGEAIAILTGDYLLTYAFEVLAQDAYMNDTVKVELIKTLSEASGGDGMILGQVIDIESLGKKLTEKNLETLHLCKTGALFGASFAFGAIIAEANEKTKKTLQQVGNNVGLAFQIVDDILDQGESCEKPSYVALFGVVDSKKIVDKLFEQVKNDLTLLNVSHTKLLALIEQLIFRNA